MGEVLLLLWDCCFGWFSFLESISQNIVLKMSLFLKNSKVVSDQISENHYTKPILTDEMLPNPMFGR